MPAAELPEEVPAAWRNSRAASGTANRAARERAAADPDPEATERRVHAERRARCWTGEENRWHLHPVGTVRDGSHIARAGPLANDEFTHERKQGRREEREAYAFDALGRVFRGLDQQPDNDDEPAQQPKHRGPSYLAILRLDTKPSCAGTCK